MYLLFADGYIQKLTQAICWTLIHSTWQGVILALLSGLIILCTKKQKASVRYNLLAGLLFLFIGISIAGFYRQLLLQQPALALSETNFGGVENSAGTITLNQLDNQHSENLVQNLVGFFNHYAGIIVLFWFMIAAFRCIKMMFAVYGIKQLQQQMVSPAGVYWNDRMNELSRQLKIKKSVRLLQSGIVKIPMVAGHFKPVLLFPIAMFAALPAHEVEAILIHELAHIRRKDYLINLIQHLTEICFFFHPAVLWVSSLIRIERENSCDDMVIAITNNKRNYVNALVAFQEYSLAPQQYASALTGKKDQLLQRIKRILYNNNKTLNGMEKTFLTLGLIITGALTLVFANETNKKISAPNNSFNKMNTRPDTIPDKKTEVTTYGETELNGQEMIVKKGMKTEGNKTIYYDQDYEIVTENNVITSVYKNGRQLSEAYLAGNMDKINKIYVDMKEKMLAAKAVSELDRKQAAEMNAAARLMEIKSLQEMEMSIALQSQQLASVQNEKKRLQEMEILQQMKSKLAIAHENLALSQLSESGSEEMIKKAKAELEAAITNDLSQRMVADKQMEELMELAKLKNIEASKMQELAMVKEKLLKEQFSKQAPGSQKIAEQQARLAKLDAERTKLQADLMYKMNKQQMIEAEKAGVSSKKMISDFVSDGLIKEGETVSFSLNNDRLIINGVKQPDAVFKKYQKKYITAKNRSFDYE